jgi:hypothetical protein
VTPRTLDEELLDPEFLRGLVVDGIVETPACEYPKSHAASAVPYWHLDGRLGCGVCHPQPEEETAAVRSAYEDTYDDEEDETSS